MELSLSEYISQSDRETLSDIISIDPVFDINRASDKRLADYVDYLLLQSDIDINQL